jgi:hypothetical protein
MARIRTIKPEFFTSETVAELPVRARLTWIGLWTYCDDHGRCRDNVKLIKAAVWPLDDVSLTNIDSDLTDLQACGLVTRYTVDGKGYMQVVNWTEHQKVSHPTDSRFPRPPSWDGGPPDGSGGPPEDSGLFPEDSGEFPLGKEGNRERNKETPAQARERESREFAEWYAPYPRHEDRIDAEKAYRAARKRGVSVETLLNGAIRYSQEKRGIEKKFIKLPATWLNKGCYDNQPESSNGRHLQAVDPRPVQAIPDFEIDVDAILGPDHWSPRTTTEVDAMPRNQRQEWFRARKAEHAAERLAEARAVLASRRGSA